MMQDSYSATFISAEGRQYPATIFLSPVTLTIRYKNESGEQKDIYWLAERIQSMEETVLFTKLSCLSLSNKMEYLQVRDANLVAAIKTVYKDRKFVGGVYHHTLGKTRNKILLVFAIVIGILTAAYFWLMPWIGERVAMNFSKEYEIELGESMYQATMATAKVDSAKTRILNEFYKKLNYAVDYPVKITVIEAQEVNAFAIPGGHIVVHDAILEGMKTPEELAALLGHEASHIAKRHSLRSMFRGFARRMFILLLTGNDTGIVGYLAANADALKGLQYSRSLETEADNEGMKLMAGSGLSAEGMLQLMNMLQQETAGKEPAAFMSTHPVFEDRLENIRTQMKNYPPASSGNHPELSKLFHDLYENW